MKNYKTIARTVKTLAQLGEDMPESVARIHAAIVAKVGSDYADKDGILSGIDVPYDMAVDGCGAVTTFLQVVREDRLQAKSDGERITAETVVLVIPVNFGRIVPDRVDTGRVTATQADYDKGRAVEDGGIFYKTTKSGKFIHRRVSVTTYLQETYAQTIARQVAEVVTEHAIADMYDPVQELHHYHVRVANPVKVETK